MSILDRTEGRPWPTRYAELRSKPLPPGTMGDRRPLTARDFVLARIRGPEPFERRAISGAGASAPTCWPTAWTRRVDGGASPGLSRRFGQRLDASEDVAQAAEFPAIVTVKAVRLTCMRRDITEISIINPGLQLPLVIYPQRISTGGKSPIAIGLGRHRTEITVRYAKIAGQSIKNRQLLALVSVFMGLGFTFYSGAVEAWLVEAALRESRKYPLLKPQTEAACCRL